MREASPDLLTPRSTSGAEFLRDLFGRDPSGALERLSHDAVWIVPGDPVYGGGIHEGRDGVLSFFALVLELFPGGLLIEELREWPGAEGSVVEAVLGGTTAAGLEYRNAYAFVVEFRDDLVKRVREYADTSYAESILHHG